MPRNARKRSRLIAKHARKVVLALSNEPEGRGNRTIPLQSSSHRDGYGHLPGEHAVECLTGDSEIIRGLRDGDAERRQDVVTQQSARVRGGRSRGSSADMNRFHSRSVTRNATLG